METLLLQRINYAYISVAKNICDLKDKEKLKNSPSGFLHNPTTIYIRKKINNKKTKFFHLDENDIYFANTFKLEIEKTFVTEDDTTIKKYIPNPFAAMQIITIERKITKNGNNLTFKIFKKTKYKSINDIYFKSNFTCNSITINIVNGDISMFCMEKNSGNKVTNIFRKNSLLQIKAHIKKMNFFDFLMPYMGTKLPFKKTEINGILCTHIQTANKNIDYTCDHNFLELIVNNFIKHKKIKLQDNFNIHNLILFYPTKKYLKKNDNNFIQAFLDKIGFKTKSLIKLLNQNPNIKFENLFAICRLFGENYPQYISKLKHDIFETNEIYKEKYTDVMSEMGIYLSKKIELSKVEKNNLLKFLNNSKKQITIEDIKQIHDHINMIEMLKKYNIRKIFKATNFNMFNEEHLMLSQELMQLKKPHYIERVYDEKIIELVNENCTFDDNDFTIMILTDEIQYNDEGRFMHHCVASYIENTASFIVSVRCVEKNERVTCEFSLSDGKLLQSKYFCNQQPPEYFENIINYLSNKISINYNLLSVPKFKLISTANYTENFSELPFII